MFCNSCWFLGLFAFFPPILISLQLGHLRTIIASSSSYPIISPHIILLPSMLAYFSIFLPFFIVFVCVRQHFGHAFMCVPIIVCLYLQDFMQGREGSGWVPPPPKPPTCPVGSGPIGGDTGPQRPKVSFRARWKFFCTVEQRFSTFFPKQCLTFYFFL